MVVSDISCIAFDSIFVYICFCLFSLFVLALFRWTPTTSGPISEASLPASPGAGTVETAPTPAADPKDASSPVLEQNPELDRKDLPTEEKKVLENSNENRQQTAPRVNGVATKKIDLDEGSGRVDHHNGVEAEKRKGVDTIIIPTQAQKQQTPSVTEALPKTKPDDAATDIQQTAQEADNVRTKKKKVVKPKSKVPSTTSV